MTDRSRTILITVIALALAGNYMLFFINRNPVAARDAPRPDTMALRVQPSPDQYGVNVFLDFQDAQGRPVSSWGMVNLKIQRDGQVLYGRILPYSSGQAVARISTSTLGLQSGARIEAEALFTPEGRSSGVQARTTATLP